MFFPTVAIIGRPNVGKSSLLNCLAKRRISIVDSVSGVTRDRVSVEIEHDGKLFELIDTGGIGVNDVDELTYEIEIQIELALKKADLILFVVDVREGVTPLDVDIAERLRRIKKPLLLVANKCDTPKFELHAGDFYKLGMGEPLTISAIEGHGKTDLLDKIIASFPALEPNEKVSAPIMKIAIVGKRNAGKSTLINTLAHEERVIVSETLGTTRDSIDVKFEIKGKPFIAIDTAGVRKKKQIQGSIEFYSMARVERSIRRADVVILLIDAPRKISQVDKKIGDYIKTQYKPCILVINKWDLAGQVETETFTNYVQSRLPGLSFSPLSFMSAMNGSNVIETIALAQEIFDQANTRISTAELNKAIEHAFHLHRPTRKKSKVAKIYYSTQVNVCPPTFVLFVNDKSFFNADYERYLSNQLRKTFPFQEIPLQFYFRPKQRDSNLQSG
ncbi:MAG: ribosome biogenesis GTPase Der [Candidatus Scalindua sp. AMX11]|nr:MAG: ribosome biogenesis GTPase Der [Candidatus Scalindua sp.]NOG83020.1 ribosome biogenesis GTPase Der [Planctomycetota bacterium]RZV79578.1 MAG: ribosome biogenesis GTPase Der [Candidatus Scalindua sp. SCAELEC01]TDE65218.1 MAG: ribosome biogenesis GTPase Der [Candidatus Scalindua sp. AMX11]